MENMVNNGVEILNQSEIIIHKYGDGLLVGTIVCILIFIIISLLINFRSCIGTELGVLCGMSCGLIFGGIVGIIVESNTAQEINTGKYQYQITISEDVKMQDFLEKYEIIEQNGKIYTVIERNEEGHHE